MIVTVPTDADPFYDEVVNLEGTDYLMTFTYSQREDCYYLSVATPDGIALATGVKIVANWPLLHRFADDRLPPGELMCIANTPVTDPAPGLGQIGPDLPFTLMYLESNQLP